MPEEEKFPEAIPDWDDDVPTDNNPETESPQVDTSHTGILPGWDPDLETEEEKL